MTQVYEELGLWGSFAESEDDSAVIGDDDCVDEWVTTEEEGDSDLWVGAFLRVCVGCVCLFMRAGVCATLWISPFSKQSFTLC